MVNQVSYKGPRPSCCSNLIKIDQILSMQWYFVPHDTLGSERIKQKLAGIEIMMLATTGSPCGLDTHAGSRGWVMGFLQGSSRDYADYATGTRGVFIISSYIHLLDSNDRT